MLRTTLAGLRSHARRFVATGLAIILGVGFVVGTLIFNDTARAGFFDTFARLAKNIDVAVEPQIQAAKGDGPPPTLTDAQANAVRTLSEVDETDARVIAVLPMLDRRGKAITNFDRVGFGLSTDGPVSLRAFDIQGAAPAAAGEAAVDVETAAHQHLAVGDTVTVLDTKGQRHSYRVVGLIDFGASRQFSDSTVVGLPAAEIRRLTGQAGYDEVVASARPGVSQPQLAAAVKRVVGDNAVVVTGDQRRTDLANASTQIATPFTVILLIFGVISLIVAAFVIYNTFAILLAQRVRETGLLRCVGATRRQVFGSALLESLVVGLAGAVAGVLAGVGVALGLLALLNDVLHAGVPAHAIVVAPQSIVVGLVVGVVVTVAAALVPAIRATRTSPLAALRDVAASGKVAGRVVRVILTALVAAVGVTLTWAGAKSSNPQAGALLVVAGGVVTFLAVLICAPLFIGPLTAAVGALPRRLFGVPVALAVANGRRNPGRTAVTSATLMIGVGMMSLFSVLIASVSETADRQLTGHYPVDYVMTTVRTNGADDGIPPAYADALRARTEFANVAEARVLSASLNATRVRIAAIDPGSLGGFLSPQMTTGRLADLHSGTIVVSATRPTTRGMAIGSRVTVQVGANTAQLTVVGSGQTTVAGAEQADALVSWDQLSALAGPGGDTVVFAKDAAGVSPATSREALDGLGEAFPLVQVNSIADISSELSSAVNGLIALFAGLIGTAVVISLFGIANTLALSVVERTRESATVRALGLTRTQLRVTLLAEALLMGVVGALVGVTYGLIYGRVLVKTVFAAVGPIIVIPWTWLAGLVLVAAAAAALAAVLPARRAAKASIVEAMADS